MDQENINEFRQNLVNDVLQANRQVDESSSPEAYDKALLAADQAKTLLRQEMLEALNVLPQRAYIDDTDAEAWVETVLQREPERAWWHYNRLFGIGGSDIGVLLGAEEGMFHPFTTAREITQQKLLKKGLRATNGDLQHGTQMKPLARDIYRKRVEARGGKSILDLWEKKIGELKDPNHPWLVGTPDDIVIENGHIYIVDCTAPMPDQIKHYDHTGVPFYYGAALHQYRLIAAKVGLKVDGLRLASLDLKAWDIDERDVPINPVLTKQILDVGDHYWNSYVLSGRLAPAVRLRNNKDLDDFEIDLRTFDEDHQHGMPASGEHLRDKLISHLEKFYRWREAQSGIQNIWNEDAVIEEIVRLGQKYGGQSREEIMATLNTGHFMNEPTYDEAKLQELLQKDNLNEGEDVVGNPRFDSAILVPASRRPDTLISLLRSLDVTDEVNWETLIIDTLKSDVKPSSMQNDDTPQPTTTEGSQKHGLGETVPPSVGLHRFVPAPLTSDKVARFQQTEESSSTLQDARPTLTTRRTR